MIQRTALLLFILLGWSTAFSQKVITQNAVFNTQTPQNMWGPGNSLGLNENFEIFPEFRPGPFNFDTSPFTTFRIAGLRVGAAINGYVDFGIGPFTFEIAGFTAGEVDIDYPTEITLILPDDDSFNPGETIVIKSAFAAEPTAELLTRYPAAGTVKLDLGLLFDVGMGVEACFGGCVSETIIPPGAAWTPPLYDSELVIFELNPDEISYICDNFGNPIEFLQSPFLCSEDISQPWDINVGSSPLSIQASLPYVETTTSIQPDLRSLFATGDSVYVTPSLDIIATLGMLPAPVGPVIGALDGDLFLPVAPDITGDIKGITIDWTIAGISLNLPITHNQEFEFRPRAFTSLTLPDEVEYVVHSRVSGDRPGLGKIIQYEVGDSISVKFPCYYSLMDITASHSFNGQLYNKTFDNIGLNIGMELFKFEVIIDDYTLFPEICIPIPFVGDLCTPEVVLSPPSIPPLGPLFEDEFVLLNNINFPPYFNENWKVDNFNTVDITQPFRLQPRQPAPTFVATNVECSGLPTGTITSDFPFAALPLEYEWSFGSRLLSPIDVPAGVHAVKITDANGCVYNEFVTITEPEPLVVVVNSTPILCNSGSNSSLTATVNGGTGPYNYLWSTGESTPEITNKPAGNYSLQVTDGVSCTTVLSVTIDEPVALTAAIYNPVNPSCFAGDDGSLDLIVEGGTPPYTYNWSNLASSQAINELQAGLYEVIVVDSKGCSVSDQLTLIEPNALVVNLTKSSDVNCFAGNEGMLTANVTGGTAPYSYSWYNESIALGVETASISELSAGDYTVEVIDNSGCRIVVNKTIDQPDTPIYGTLTLTHLGCKDVQDGAIDLTVSGGSPPYNFRWSNGEITEDIENLDAGEYEVEVTDAKGCTFGTQTLIIVPKSITASVRVEPVSCALQEDGSVEVVNIKGGIPPFEIEFSNGEQASKIEDLAQGMYSFTINDAAGCSFYREVEVYLIEGECLFIPSAFSPNGDGINDTWEIQNIHLYPGVSIRVFNKWNIDVFRSDGDYQPWNGTYNGNLLEPTVYYYIINLNDGSPIRKGTLTIL